MAITEIDKKQAEARMKTLLKKAPRAVSARYERRTDRIIINLNFGLQLAFSPSLAQDLASADQHKLRDIEISPTGLGLHFPQLDVDLYIPGLLEGLFGSPQWTARNMGKHGGKSCSKAKQAAARTNGKLGGRPRKVANG